MSARQNKRQRSKRNPNIHRERTVTTLTGNDDDEHSFVVSPNSDEQPSSYSNMVPTGLPFGFNNFVGPINAGMHAQQQQYYLPQQTMLPPGQNDLEILENLKESIKRGQNPFFRAVPNPAALASIYLGSSNAPSHPEQNSRVDAQANSIPENSNDDQGRRPHMQGKEVWDTPRKLSVSSGQNNANAAPQDSPNKLSQESILKDNSKSTEGGGPNGLSARPPLSGSGKDERLLGRETYPPPPTSRDSDRTAPPPSSASVPSSPSSNAPTARDSSSRYHDSRDRDLRDRDREWDRDNYPYRRDDRRISDARRPDYSDARPHESNYPLRRYDSKDDYAGNDRRRDDRLPPRPDPSRLDLPPRPDDRYPPRPDDRLPPRPDDRYSHRPDDRASYDRLSRPDDRPLHRPDDRPHRYDDRRFDRPLIGESRVAAAAAAERDRAAAAAAAASIPPPSRPSVSSRPPPSSGPTRPLEERGAVRPPPPTVTDSKAPSARPPPKLEERISRPPTLQERLSQTPATSRVVEPPTRTLSLEERLSHAPVSNNSAAATAQSDDRRSNTSDRERPAPNTRPDERSSSTASSAGRGGAAETSRPLPASVPDDRDRPPILPAAPATAPRAPTDDTRGRTIDRFASRGTTPAPTRPAGAPTVPPSAPSNYSRAASVARDDSRRVSPARHHSYRSSVPPPPRGVSRDRQMAVNPRAGSHNYRPGDDRAYSDRHRDSIDVDPPSSSRYANGEYSRRPPSPAPLSSRRAGYPSPPPSRPAVDAHAHGTYDDRDRRLSANGGRDYVYDSDRRRDWPPAEDDPYYKSRSAYLPPPPSDRDRYDRDSRDMAPVPPTRSGTWDSRGEHDRRTPSGPATGSSYHPPTRSPPPRSSTGISESSTVRSLTSRLDYPPPADDRDRSYPPPRAEVDRSRYTSSAAGDSTYSRVRARSPSPARRPPIDDRPPVKRAREDIYPSSGSGSHYPPAASSYSRDVPSAPRRPSDYPPPRSVTPPSGGYYPPPGSSVDRDYRRDYPAPYDRPRSPPRGGVSGGYASSGGYRTDSRDDRRYMAPPPLPR